MSRWPGSQQKCYLSSAESCTTCRTSELACSRTRSELVQAVGRGRGILPSVIPVYLVTTENPAPPDADDGRNGYLFAEGAFAPLTEVQARVLGRLPRGGGRIVGKVPDIAKE